MSVRRFPPRTFLAELRFPLADPDAQNFVGKIQQTEGAGFIALGGSLRPVHGPEDIAIAALKICGSHHILMMPPSLVSDGLIPSFPFVSPPYSPRPDLQEAWNVSLTLRLG